MKILSGVRWLLLVVGAGLIASGARAQGPGVPGPGFGQHKPPMERSLGVGSAWGQWWNHPHVIEKLKLTDEQRKTMDAVLLEHRKRLIDLRANVQKGELDLEPLMNADQPNEAKLLAQIDLVAQSRAELEKANARFLLALRNKITLEQWKQLQELRLESRREHGPWNASGTQKEQRPFQGHGPVRGDSAPAQNGLQ